MYIYECICQNVVVTEIVICGRISSTQIVSVAAENYNFISLKSISK